MIEERMNLDKVKFGKFVAGRRKALPESPTQKELAQKLHVGTSAIGKIEAGETLPSFELFIDLADALQMSPGELMMVLAEREDGSKHFQEMNNWLFEKINQALAEYQALFIPTRPGPGPQAPLKFPQKDRQAGEIVAEVDEKQKKKFPKKPLQDQGNGTPQEEPTESK